MNNHATKVIAFILASCVFGFISQANAAVCYEIARTDGPEAESIVVRQETERWCYEKLESPNGGLYIYNADGERVKPELAMIVEPDGHVTHGSLLAGDITVHRIQAAGFSPLGVPLQEPKAISGMSLSSTELDKSAREVLDFLLSQPGSFEDLSVREGDFEAMVSANTVAWRGYWWPYKGSPLYGGSNSPLAKYDRYVKARTGSNPGAQAWESSRHRYKGVSWEGHCNGWAASSVLRRQPTAPRHDSVTGITFSVSDQKGILAEVDYCAKVAFFGSRYRGSGDIRDIYPAQFHNTITYYIGSLKKPVAMDYMASSPVDNHVVSGYKLNMQKTGTNRYLVTMTLTVHKYDMSRIEAPGVAPTYQRTYRYRLTTDNSGRAVSGTWLTANPDFLWVPLAIGDCGTNNPNVSSNWAEQIIY